MTRNELVKQGLKGVGVARKRIVKVRERLRRPIRAASIRLQDQARDTWKLALVRFRDALEVPARSDLERLGKRLELMQHKLEEMGRKRFTASKA